MPGETPRKPRNGKISGARGKFYSAMDAKMRIEESVNQRRESLRPLDQSAARKRLNLKSELALAVLPTATILGVFALVEAFSSHRLLFASLAGTAYLIYHDPHHKTNHFATILIAQIGAAAIGVAAGYWLGYGYAAGGAAMIAVIAATFALDRMHAPAAATALSFAFRAESVDDLPLFAASVGLLGILVLAQRTATVILTRAES